jgi:Fe-S-cluster-containing dehydrogenase component
MEKCTFCVQRIKAAEIQAAAEKRELRDGEFNPACVQTCPTEALVFGDLNNPSSRVSLLSKSDRATKLLAEVGTLPKVTYLIRETWLEEIHGAALQGLTPAREGATAPSVAELSSGLARSRKLEIFRC